MLHIYPSIISNSQNLSKSNCQYHKIFKEISKEEQLRQSYTCALQKDMLYQGRMFVSDHWICFHSKVFGRDTKIAIPVTSITNIKKTKTAILVPNALVVATANDREKSPCSSPIPSSAEHSFRGQRSPLVSRFPLTPDDDKLAGFPATPLLDVLAHSDKAAPPPEQQLRARQQQLNQQSPEKSLTGSEVMINSRVLRPISLSTLLIVYMFLVCVLVLSSCFLAFKIVSLEQKLQTLGSVSDFTHNVNGLLSGGADLNTEIFSEVLTINLLKLERVQKNLQRLLEEAD
ncbi:unnamed protein product [Menidia menidia]|uniref:(Atlantic silverside) hypothetical protein n=1 Tax=Menidia menidia TaxID=238744 RepID=A0A8S4B248_9TELE|nr:unnamed protein product [Menidia menidia]